jgi:hypothetical protein
MSPGVQKPAVLRPVQNLLKKFAGKALELFNNFSY